MKKFISYLLVLTLILGAISLVACNNDTQKPDDGKEDPKDDGNKDNPKDPDDGKEDPKDPDDGKDDPAPTPVAANALEILDKIWASYTDDEKFFACGGLPGDDSLVENKPGECPTSAANLFYNNLSVKEEDVASVKTAASLLHGMNSNTFTGFVLEAKDGVSVTDLAAKVDDSINNRHFMCGFPEKRVILTVGNFLIAAYGDGELVNDFLAKAQTAYSSATVAYNAPIGE